MFYLTYRPKTIAQIDTAQVRTSLTNVLHSPILPHSLLLIGSKGLGKTSSARILAKAINCLENKFAGKNDSIEPCNTCSNCVAITKSNSVDIIEMDAASHRKIDDIRDLLEKVHYTPILTRYKVYIIDEVHMLTTESFNALLKTLEEPPSHTIFILATTEYDKVPKTILSRSMQIAFPKAKKQDIVHMLERIVAQEKLNVDKEILEKIAELSDSSFRDGAKLLEQLSFEKDFSTEKLHLLVGISNNDFDLLKLLEKKDIKQALNCVDTYYTNGGNCRVLIEMYLRKLHDILLEKSVISTKTPSTYTLTLSQTAQLIRLFQEAYNITKVSPIEILPLEVAIVEYGNIQ